MSSENINGRRLSPEELASRLPSILGAARRKANAIEERKSFNDFKKTSSSSVGEGAMGAAFRKAVSEGVRFRATNGRFIALPKNK